MKFDAIELKSGDFIVINGVRYLMRGGNLTCDIKLSDPEMKPEMDALLKQIKEDPAVGKKLMVDAGIWNEDGSLTDKYKGAYDED